RTPGGDRTRTLLSGGSGPSTRTSTSAVNAATPSVRSVQRARPTPVTRAVRVVVTGGGGVTSATAPASGGVTVTPCGAARAVTVSPSWQVPPAAGGSGPSTVTVVTAASGPVCV